MKPDPAPLGPGMRCAPWWSAVLLALPALAAWRGSDSGAYFDRAALIELNAWRSLGLDTAFAAVTWLGSLSVLLPLVAIAGILLWRRSHRGEARFLVVALLGAALLAQLAKHVALRPRPDMFQALTSVAEPYGFPSVHAAQSGAAAVGLLLVVARLAPRQRLWAAPLLLLLALLVGVSRLYLQVHYPSDVVAGGIAGAGWVVGLRAVMLPERSCRK